MILSDEEKLSNPKVTVAVLKKFDFDFKKRYGQNFLIDSHVLHKIMDAAELTNDSFVLEIGPGIGTMTQYLCEEAGQVLAVEIDRTLIPVLETTLSMYDNVRVINKDILKVNLDTVSLEYNQGRKIDIVANLPYYITTPIVMGILEKHAPVSTITVMVQKEVAERMQAGPGTKSYGSLSLAVQYFAEPYIAAYVPPNCFMPRPGVGSAVIRLRLYDEPAVKVRDEKQMFDIIHAAFQQRRKTLQNGIAHFAGLDYSKEQVAEALRSLKLSENIRGEAMDLTQFAALSDRLTAMKES